ncbi:MAG: sigma-70 family RNA polymerase sigma factor [Bryobacteraceae bacterium]
MLTFSLPAGFGRPAPRSEADLISLLGRVATGDQQALADFYDRTSRLVYSVVVRIVADPADAEEVTLDVYNQVWRSASSYTPDRGAPATWLLMAARSRALDRIRSSSSRSRHEAQLEPTHDPASGDDAVDDSAWFVQRNRLVRDAMADLQPDQRQLIELSFFEGLTHSQLAERVNQPLGTVKTRIRNGLTKLRQTLSSTRGIAS